MSEEAQERSRLSPEDRAALRQAFNNLPFSAAIMRGAFWRGSDDLTVTDVVDGLTELGQVFGGVVTEVQRVTTELAELKGALRGAGKVFALIQDFAEDERGRAAMREEKH